MKNLKFVVLLALLAIAAGVVAFFATRPESQPEAGRQGDPEPAAPAQIAEVATSSSSGDSSDEPSSVAEDPEPESESMTEEERKVEAFDSETDKWMDVEKANSPTMQDIHDFAKKFKELPEDRKEECLQRALNLIPDDNVMLLVGILMDKSQKKDFAELIYNDVLNRSDDVKKPILKQIHSDKSHPCWADTAWILDVTGENDKDL